MKKLLLATICALALVSCVSENEFNATTHEQAAQYIALQTNATEWGYTYEYLEPKRESVLIEFYVLSSPKSESKWICEGAGQTLKCTRIYINYLNY